MKKLLFILFLGVSLTSFGQTNEQRITDNTNIDVDKFSNLVKGQIPALALTSEQLAEVRAIFKKKNVAASGLDPYKMGKLNSVKEYQALEIDALKEAMKVLTLEQKMAYKKNKEALDSGD